MFFVIEKTMSGPIRAAWSCKVARAEWLFRGKFIDLDEGEPGHSGLVRQEFERSDKQRVGTVAEVHDDTGFDRALGNGAEALDSVENGLFVRLIDDAAADGRKVNT